ncbi:MAG: hypothetical protein E7483_00465 [Ruminococcaceae bacterium]|nr:hypothetical protein [Oscillospiraceae bacterium]
MNIEYQQLKEYLKKAELGSFLIVPLKYSNDNFSADWLENNSERIPFTTTDINESVKQTINAENTANVVIHYKLNKNILYKNIFGKHKTADEKLVLWVSENDKNEKSDSEPIEITDLDIYIFHTQVAFLSVGIRYNKMNVLNTICNLGYAKRISSYYCEKEDGEICRFDLEKEIKDICSFAGLQIFLESDCSIFLDSYIFTVAMIEKRFKNLETIRQATFNLHLMQELENPVEDESEEDINYVYAVKAQSLGSYRWGCCVTSQTMSYIVADSDMNITAEMAEQLESNVTVILLALYQKYTCLRFRELLAITDKRKIDRLKMLKRQMLEFKAYGTITPANLSRWHNVKQIYKHILETNEINQAVENIGITLDILAEHQKELENDRSSKIMGLITLFGVVSIPASVLSIIDYLAGGSLVSVYAAIITILSMGIIIVLMLLQNKKE